MSHSLCSSCLSSDWFQLGPDICQRLGRVFILHGFCLWLYLLWNFSLLSPQSLGALGFLSALPIREEVDFLPKMGPPHTSLWLLTQPGDSKQETVHSGCFWVSISLQSCPASVHFPEVSGSCSLNSVQNFEMFSAGGWLVGSSLLQIRSRNLRPHS